MFMLQQQQQKEMPWISRPKYTLSSSKRGELGLHFQACVSAFFLTQSVSAEMKWKATILYAFTKLYTSVVSPINNFTCKMS